MLPTPLQFNGLGFPDNGEIEKMMGECPLFSGSGLVLARLPGPAVGILKIKDVLKSGRVE